MINGYKPNGHFRTFSDLGHKIEGETRQCVHCQFMWNYQPGSGSIRGFCIRHNGFTCNRDQCNREQRNRIAALGDWPFECITFEDYNAYRFEKFLKLNNYQVTTSGLLVPVVE